MKRKLAIAATAVILMSMVMAVLVLSGLSEVKSASCAPPSSDATNASASLSPGRLTVKGQAMTQQQATNAAVIVEVAVSNGLPSQAAVIGIMTAIQESTLNNIPYGYPGSTSVGLFQQIAAWGSYQDRMNPHVSSRMFFFGGQAGQRGLVDVPGWQQLSLNDAAQEVQGSGYPDAYAQHQPEAEAIVASVTGAEMVVAQVSAETVCAEEPDILELAVRAALSKQGDEYEWNEQPYTGAALVQWAFEEAGLKLPGTVDGLRAYDGTEGGGVKTEWIPASRFRSGDASLTRGDLVFWNAAGQTQPDRVALYVGTSGIRVGTFNVLGKSHQPSTWQTRIRRSYQMMRDYDLGLVGLQELQPDQRRALLALSAGRYEMFPKTAVYGNGNNASVDSIMWDSTQFELLEAGYIPKPYYYGRKNQKLPLVKLREYGSGQEFYLSNTHDPARPDFSRQRFMNARQHAADMDRLSGTGTPVIMTGDFNSGFDLRPDGNTTYQNQRENLTWCIMTRSGLVRNAYDAFKGRLGECPSVTTRERGQGPIDHVYLSRELPVTGFEVVRGDTGSDHPMVYADTVLEASGDESRRGMAVFASERNEQIQLQTLPRGMSGVLRLTIDEIALASAVSGPWRFPLQKGAYTFTHNSYGPRSLGGDDWHNGTDFGTGGGTPPLVAMHGGTIVRKGWGGAWGNYYVVETGVPVPGKFDATYKYLYAHLSRYAPGLSVGDRVGVGQYLGNVGNTGNSFGEHLHLTICTSMDCTYGNAAGSVDPIPFLVSVGVRP